MPSSRTSSSSVGSRPELLRQALLGGVEPGQRLADVHREADGAPLVARGPA